MRKKKVEKPIDNYLRRLLNDCKPIVKRESQNFLSLDAYGQNMFLVGLKFSLALRTPPTDSPLRSEWEDTLNAIVDMINELGIQPHTPGIKKD